MITIAGHASDDGTIVLRNSDGKVWRISNPEMLRDYEGLPVVIRGHIEANQGKDLHILSVQAGKSEVGYVTNWGDSAFRR